MPLLCISFLDAEGYLSLLEPVKKGSAVVVTRWANGNNVMLMVV